MLANCKPYFLYSLQHINLYQCFSVVLIQTTHSCYGANPNRFDSPRGVGIRFPVSIETYIFWIGAYFVSHTVSNQRYNSYKMCHVLYVYSRLKHKLIRVQNVSLVFFFIKLSLFLECFLTTSFQWKETALLASRVASTLTRPCQMCTCCNTFWQTAFLCSLIKKCLVSKLQTCATKSVKR